MTFFINFLRILLIYWIIAAVIRFVRNMRESSDRNSHVRGNGRSPNRPADPDIPPGDIEDADFEEIRDK